MLNFKNFILALFLFKLLKKIIFFSKFLVFLIILNRNPDGGWQAAKQMMANSKELIVKLKNYSDRIGKIAERTIQRVKRLIEDEVPDMSKVINASPDAAGMLTWV